MQELSTPNYVKKIAIQLNIQAGQVKAALHLLDEGNTIPFIARYRKEMTGELDEVQLRNIAERYEFEKNLHQRKSDVLRLLDEHGVMADEVKAKQLLRDIETAKTLTEVDDIYRPYRPKRKTRASIAKEQGLEPLAAWLLGEQAKVCSEESVRAFAKTFVTEKAGIETVDEALAGAIDIFAEEVADNADVRKWIRHTTFEKGIMKSVAVDSKTESVYAPYYDYQEPVAKVLPHRILAMNRGEKESCLKLSILAPDADIYEFLALRYVRSDKAGTFISTLLDGGIRDSYKRLIAPAIEREIRADLTTRAEEQAIHVFGENLKHLLMQPPIRGQSVLGVDPAYRTGCKLAIVDDTGKMLEVAVIYPTPPQNKIEEAKKRILGLLAEYHIGLVAIGNGTASRETEAFIADCVSELKDKTGEVVPYILVSEAGASVYSASPLAGEEFPSLDVSERSAISIARRIQDPLAELVKIDPKSVGVGQYQHDVSQKHLDDKLSAVVETAVNQVGVDVNTASPSLLSYVSGLNKTVAKNIVEFREANGRFKNKKILAKVPRLGKKTLEQCVGFLRVPDGEEILDDTPIHPESYDVVHKLLQLTGKASEILRTPALRKEWITGLRSFSVHALSEQVGVGIPTLRDILDALERPGRDPREDVPPPILRTDVLKLEDIEVGMILTGTIRNVVDFGAFVDVGIKNDGLVHISELADRFVKNPFDVVSVGDIVKVRVIQIDLQKQRLSLSMKGQF